MKTAKWSALLAALSLVACETTTPPPIEYVPPQSDVVSVPSWAETGPTPADYIRVYPGTARRLGIETVARLTCTIREDRKLDCVSGQEEYPNLGFGEAAVQVSRLFVVKASNDPMIQPGKTVILPIDFRLTE